MKLIILLFIVTPVFSAFAQNDYAVESKADFGLGIGVDYGGFGGRITYLPAKSVGIFAGLGYNLAGLGYNLGGMLRLAPDHRVVPCLYAMYGYNGVIRITGQVDVRKIYYGPSFGGGFQIKSKRNPINFFNFELLIPIRPASYENDLNFYKSQGVSFTDPLPVSFSFGYHISF